MTYILPAVGTLDKWITTSVEEAQGKKQRKLIRKVNNEYEDFKLFVSEVVNELNRLKEG